MTHPVAKAVTRSGARERLLESARREIEERGILGLRVADVAAGAHYSVSVLYRYFGDRDGLLAEVLGEMYAEVMDRTGTRVLSLLPESGPLTIDDVLQLLPMPSEAYGSADLRIRLQILAVAATNPALEARIAEIAQQNFVRLRAFAEQVRSRLPEGQAFDERVFTVQIVNQLLYYNTLLGEYSVDDETYRAFLRDKITRR